MVSLSTSSTPSSAERLPLSVQRTLRELVPVLQSCGSRCVIRWLCVIVGSVRRNVGTLQYLIRSGQQLQLPPVSYRHGHMPVIVF
jgi:hypothetical protein